MDIRKTQITNISNYLRPRSPRQELITQNLVMHLDANDINSYSGSGSIWYDLSGNNNNAIIQGATFNSSSPSYFSLDGVNDYFSTSFNPNLDNYRKYTYSIWFWDNSPGINNGGSNTALISNYGPSSTTPYSYIHINENGTARVGERNTSGVSGDVSSSSLVIDSSWKNIVFTTGSSNGYMYINGVFEAQTTRPGGTITSGQNFVLGGNHLNRYQSCRIAHIAIYLDKEFSESEIQSNYLFIKNKYQF